jgi:uncharacterized protein
MTNADITLEKFASAIRAHYGPRVERLVLYGSRARGDQAPDSDYDIALFLTDLRDRWIEVRQLVGIEHQIRDETGADIHTMPFPAGSWRNSDSSLMHAIRRDGLDL